MTADSSEDIFRIQLGQNSIKLLQFRKNKSSGDIYGWFGIPDVGLHISGHMPKPPLHPYAHLHLKSDILGIHEDIADFDPTDVADYYRDFAEDFINDFYEPEPDESITMLPMTAHTFTSGSFNVPRLFQAMTGTYYRTNGNRLSRLLTNNPSLLDTIGISDNGIVLPIDTNVIFEIPFKSRFNYFNKLLLGKPLSSFADPITKALEIVQRNSPNSLTKWIPPSTVGSFIQETQAIIKKAKPQIIDY